MKHMGKVVVAVAALGASVSANAWYYGPAPVYGAAPAVTQEQQQAFAAQQQAFVQQQQAFAQQQRELMAERAQAHEAALRQQREQLEQAIGPDAAFGHPFWSPMADFNEMALSEIDARRELRTRTQERMQKHAERRKELTERREASRREFRERRFADRI